MLEWVGMRRGGNGTGRVQAAGASVAPRLGLFWKHGASRVLPSIAEAFLVVKELDNCLFVSESVITV